MNDTASDLSRYVNHRNAGLAVLVLTYVLAGYGLGVYSLTASAWWVNLIGLGLVTHTLMCAAYLVHDLIHGNIFRRAALNEAVGQVLLF